jgi:Flp pilus assembly protein TadG
LIQRFFVRLHSHWKFRHSDHRPSRRLCAGQGLVEFALTLPLLILIMVGILDLGRIYFAYMSIVNASREGARAGAASNEPPLLNPNTCTSTIFARAQGEVDANIVQLDPEDISCKRVTNDQGDPTVQVKVTYKFQLILGIILGGGKIPLQSSAEMVIFGQ